MLWLSLDLTEKHFRVGTVLSRTCTECYKEKRFEYIDAKDVGGTIETTKVIAKRFHRSMLEKLEIVEYLFVTYII